jgi:hypothetical protein
VLLWGRARLSDTAPLDAMCCDGGARVDRQGQPPAQRIPDMVALKVSTGMAAASSDDLSVMSAGRRTDLGACDRMSGAHDHGKDFRPHGSTVLRIP